MRRKPLSERTLVLIKPDGVRRGLAGDVLSRIERKGLRIVAMDMRVVAKDLAETHYAEHTEKPFYGSLVEFITSGPLVALVDQGHERAGCNELDQRAVERLLGVFRIVGLGQVL